MHFFHSLDTVFFGALVYWTGGTGILIYHMTRHDTTQYPNTASSTLVTHEYHVYQDFHLIPLLGELEHRRPNSGFSFYRKAI